MGDEGIGPAIVERLGQVPLANDLAEYVDLGTRGLALLHVIDGRQKAVIIDCALMGLSPGQMRRFTLDQVAGTKVLSGVSDHQADLLGLLTLAKTLGQLPKEVVIFGIQPRLVGPGMHISEDLMARIDYYLETIMAELGQPVC